MASPFKREDVTPAPKASTETVIIRTPSGKEFILHARPLAHQSRYFRTALNSKFQEATTREFNMIEHCHDEILGALTSWVYLKSIGVSYRALGLPFLWGLGQILMVKAWLFGDFIQAPAFQNDVMKWIVNVSNSDFNVKLFELLGSSIPEHSPLEDYFVDRFCSLMFHKARDMMDWMMDQLPKHLTERVCKKLATFIWEKERWVNNEFYDWGRRKATEYEVQE
ncbi:hypothetical protein GGR55DRAFT_674976 [Xylaria sp. FL0064]|nr:hypothetical protein GGR55DRAFT_674976 [Xylaria sp. FL0064]